MVTEVGEPFDQLGLSLDVRTHVLRVKAFPIETVMLMFFSLGELHVFCLFSHNSPFQKALGVHPLMRCINRLSRVDVTTKC